MENSFKDIFHIILYFLIVFIENKNLFVFS